MTLGELFMPLLEAYFRESESRKKYYCNGQILYMQHETALVAINTLNLMEYSLHTFQERLKAS